MKSWIISCNPKAFDAIEAFNHLDSVFWAQSQPMKNFQVGDEVYIYICGDLQQIIFKCEIKRVQIPYSSEVDKDKPFWGEEHEVFSADRTKLYMELVLVGENRTKRLTFADLKKHGETSRMQGAKNVSGEYLAYIDSFFSNSIVYIQDLLKGINADFDSSSRVKLVRHTTTHRFLDQPYSGTISDLYKNKDLFSIYQNHQKKSNFLTTEYIVSFIAEDGVDSLFVGVFKNNGITSETSNETCFFGFEEVPGFENLKEQVIVKWSNPRGWHQWYDNKMEVVVQKTSQEETKNDHRFQQFHLNTNDRTRHTQESESVIEAQHQKMQEGIVACLGREGYTDIVIEEDHVDIRANKNGIPHFFEVKTYDTAKACIREALGQILEYNHYPNNNRAAEMYIIGPVKPTQEDCRYLECIRGRYKMRLFYRAFDEKNQVLLPAK